MKPLVLALCMLCSLPASALTYNELYARVSSAEMLFVSHAEHPELMVDADSVSQLRRYHNQYLREPMYDDYMYVTLQKMFGMQGFQHLFRNLGGGFVPVRIIDEQLIMRGTRDHCGGMEEALIMVDMQSGDVSGLLYSEDTFLIHSTYSQSSDLPRRGLRWIERILDAYGTSDRPTRNKELLRKMAGDWCRADSP